MKNNKFTFKTIKPIGRWKTFDNPQHTIKLNGKEVGAIDHESPFKIRLTVLKIDPNENGNPNSTWKWITLNKESESLDQAKEWLNSVRDKIIEKYNLYFIE